MEYNLTTLQPVLPEIFLLSAACLILVIDLFLTEKTRLLTYGLSLAALIGTIALTQYAAGPAKEIILSGSFVRDPMADVLKTGLVAVALFAFVYAKDYLRSQEILRRRWLVEKKATLQELADDFGVSAERIRQIEKNAMKKMKDAMQAA